jgi:hypothetical protein
MAKKREPIDDMLDTHVWVRRQEALLWRILTLDDIPDELFAEYVLRLSDAVARSYRCTDPA